jgi:hypothetical protein
MPEWAQGTDAAEPPKEDSISKGCNDIELIRSRWPGAALFDKNPASRVRGSSPLDQSAAGPAHSKLKAERMIVRAFARRSAKVSASLVLKMWRGFLAVNRLGV